MNKNDSLQPLTVSQLTQSIKLQLESNFQNVSLQGEISNFKEQSSGHLYFSLKDANAQIAAVMFKADAALLKLMPKGGDHVVVRGEINVYPPKGNYQLIVRELSYIGLGELLLRLEELKIKLHQMGWFKSARKKKLPQTPKRIGVVTSPTGAVIQDIINVLTRRFAGFQLILNPVKVQGQGAAQEIAQAIQQFNDLQLVDVMIVGRGGGSLEDLWAFNEEIVAEALFNSRIPTISAVGHETDHCIADYVADVRAPTPSAAAEIVIAERMQLIDTLTHIQRRMQQSIRHLIHQHRLHLQGIRRHPFFTQPLAPIEKRMQQMDDAQQMLDDMWLRHLREWRHKLQICSQKAYALQPLNHIKLLKEQLLGWQQRINHAMCLCLERKQQRYHQTVQRITHLSSTEVAKTRQRFDHLIFALTAIDPKNLLKKGFSILLAEEETEVINSVQKLKVGQKARLVMADGKAEMVVAELSRSRPLDDENRGPTTEDE